MVLEICEGAVEYRNSINDEDRKTFQSRNFYDDAGVFVLSNEEVSKGPIFQLFSEGKKQICKKSNSGFIDQLKAELGRDCVWDQRDYDSEHRGFAQGRWLEIGKNERFIILLCGETNLTKIKTMIGLKSQND